MLKASQVRTKRAAFSEAAMSSVPAKLIGWLATTPTEWPSTRPKPTTMFGANPAWISRNSPSSTTCSITWCMSYGWFAESGMRVSSSWSTWVTVRSAGESNTGTSSMLLDGRYDRRALANSRQSASSAAS